jgi:acyl-lipid omega-6 desaturase (Delta-12 desaturase)
MTSSSASEQPRISADWRTIFSKYLKPSALRASWQLINSMGSYLLIWVLFYYSQSISWWLAPPLMILAGGFLLRAFIIFHDCGHGSFFASQRANDFWGSVAGLLTFTPYFHWRGEHAVHHGTSGDLDRRGTGDVWTMTVKEYLASSRWKRFSYRLLRNPFVLFVVSPTILFLVLERYPRASADRRERHSVWWMNLALLLTAIGVSSVVGVVPYLIFQLGSLAIAASAGVWLFYVQHQFEDVYWERGDQWDYFVAAMKGSSYFKLPRILQWFTGNIGFHHIHHLNPRIPNYNLERCHESDPMFGAVAPITLFASLRTMSLRLWDESSRKLVGFAHLRNLQLGE